LCGQADDYFSYDFAQKTKNNARNANRDFHYLTTLLQRSPQKSCVVGQTIISAVTSCRSPKTQLETPVAISAT
jgi:hypothetical protein